MIQVRKGTDVECLLMRGGLGGRRGGSCPERRERVSGPSWIQEVQRQERLSRGREGAGKVRSRQQQACTFCT